MPLVHAPYVPATGLHDMSMSDLTDQLQLFASVHGFPEDGAETLLGREDITSSQREWLEAFIAAWEIAETEVQTSDEPTPLHRASALLEALCNLYPGVDLDVMLRSVHADLRHVADALGVDHSERSRAGHETYAGEVARHGALTPDDGKDVL